MTLRRGAHHRVVAASCLMLLGLTGVSPAVADSRSRELTIDVSTSAVVGQRIAVTVEGARRGDVMILIAVGSLGTTTLTETAGGTAVRFSLPVAFTRTAGVATVLARDSDATATAAISLVPGPVAGPVQSVVGARTVVADGTDRSMVVAIPVDRWGNAVSSGSVVRFTRKRTDGSTEASDVQSLHLIAWREFSSGTLAGRDLVWATASGSAGQPNALEEVAGAPLPFSFHLQAQSTMRTTRADGQSLIAIESSVLADRFGNVEPDGTQITVHFTSPDGRGQASAVTIAGVARLFLRAPSEPGNLSIVGASRGVQTAGTLSLAFASAIDTVVVSASRSAGTIAVRVGQILNFDGSIIADGTAVTVVMTNDSGWSKTSTGTLANGFVTLRLESKPGELSIATTVLGLTRTVVVQ